MAAYQPDSVQGILDGILTEAEITVDNTLSTNTFTAAGVVWIYLDSHVRGDEEFTTQLLVRATVRASSDLQSLVDKITNTLDKTKGWGWSEIAFDYDERPIRPDSVDYANITVFTGLVNA